MNRARVRYAGCNRDELPEPLERNALYAPTFMVRVCFALGRVFEFGNRRRRRIDVRSQQTGNLFASGNRLKAKFPKQRVQQERLAAGKLADDGEHERCALQPLPSGCDAAPLLGPEKRFQFVNLFENGETSLVVVGEGLRVDQLRINSKA